MFRTWKVRTVLASALVSATLSLPTLAVAEGGPERSDAGFHALSSLDEHALAGVQRLDDVELREIEGGRFFFRRFAFNTAFNIAIAPQLNICIFCNGVSQSNFLVIFGLNDLS